MDGFKIICPECSAWIVTANPESLIWERCPACCHHLWDTYDILMAEIVTKGRSLTTSLDYM